MTNILETVVFADGEGVTTEANTTQAGTAANGAEQPEVNPVMSGIMTILPFALVIVLLYFMMIRPQRKREKETKEMINAMKVGDKVVTIGGICGKVVKIKDEFVFIETGNIGTQDEKSVLKMERDAVRSVEGSKK
ncbi:MAG: preprotein translocase subunit YajC [Oscillospiraceae bacterium]|nr:preprotein translocase subunit YajC [Oscillospiraceae bacterium]